MKYLDPMLVECPHCGETREYSVDDLRHFRAICLVCNHGLSEIGAQMREHEAYWGHVLDLVTFTLKLEEKLGIEYQDKEVESLKTLEQVMRLTLSKLPSDFNVDRVKQVIFETASEVGNYTASELSMGMSLREVLEKVD